MGRRAMALGGASGVVAVPSGGLTIAAAVAAQMSGAMMVRIFGAMVPAVIYGAIAAKIISGAIRRTATAVSGGDYSGKGISRAQ